MTGATGYVGSRLVTALLANGHRVVAVTRNRSRLKRFGWYDDVTGITLDAADGAVTRAAFAAAGLLEVVFYLVHGIGRTAFRDADRAAAENVATAAGLPVTGVDTAVASRVTAFAQPVPDALAGELVESLDHPIFVAGTGLRDLVPDPPGGLTVDDAIARTLSSPSPGPVNTLTDPHHLADSDPVWAGGDVLRIRRLAGTATPRIARLSPGLVNAVPGPVAGALRSGLDMLIALTPKVRPA